MIRSTLQKLSQGHRALYALGAGILDLTGQVRITQGIEKGVKVSLDALPLLL